MDEKKKTTAQKSSVGADERQPLIKTTTGIVTEKDEKNKSTQETQLEVAGEQESREVSNDLLTISLDELMNNVYLGKSAVIEGLLYTGAYILAGAPKIGKSFLVAQIAYHVSMGKPLWGYEVHQGPVLYLALEDDHRRLQTRMARMFGVDGTGDLLFATDAKQIGKGLFTQLEAFLEKHETTQLVIVDTLQKVREVVGDNYSYANDYEIIGRFKEFADKNNLAILIVHHTRKQPAGDSFEMISGTSGLLGCADGAFLMQKEKRTDGNATLEIVGRDQPDQKLYLVKDQDRLIWKLERAENKLWKEPSDPLLEAINQWLTGERTIWQGSATELIAALNLDVPANALTKKLNVRAGRLMNDFKIQYVNSHSRSGSKITLSRLTEKV